LVCKNKTAYNLDSVHFLFGHELTVIFNMNVYKLNISPILPETGFLDFFALYLNHTYRKFLCSRI